MAFDMQNGNGNGNGNGGDGDWDSGNSITHVYLGAASGEGQPSGEEVTRFHLTLQGNGLSVQPKENPTTDGKIIYTVNGCQAFVSQIFQDAGAQVSHFDPASCQGIDARKFSQLEGALTVRLPDRHA